MSRYYSLFLYKMIYESQDRHFWFRARNDLILRVIGRYSDKHSTFLEVGCGTGNVLRALKKLDLKLVGMDINIESIRYAARDVPDVRFIRRSIMTYKKRPGDTFKSVGAFDVLEHIPDDVVFLRHCHRLLTRGGFLYITVPAGMWLWDELDKVAGHQRRYESRELISKVNKAGFRVVWWNYWQTLPLPLFWLWRVLMKADKRDEQSAYLDYLKPPAEPINTLLYWMLRFEQLIITRMKLPIGASIIMCAQKV